MARAADFIQIYGRWESRRSPWDQTFQLVSEIFLPNQADFTQANAKGRLRATRNFENTHRQAARNFAATLGSLVGPQSADQLTIMPVDEERAEVDESRLWLDHSKEIMWRAMARTGARFNQAKAETDTSLVVLGTGVLFIGENASRDGLLFRSHHLRDVAFGTDAAGQVDRIGFRRRLTAQQAVEEYGEANVGDKTREIWQKPANATDKDQRFTFLHLVMPRSERDARRIGNRDMPFASVVVDVESEHIVRESGYQEFPFAVPRWETSPDEIYGRSPAMLAFADARTLQAIARTMLLAGQMAADPPKWLMNDAVMGVARLYPGGVTAIDSQSASVTGGNPPMGVLDLTGAKMPIGRDMQADYRAIVQSAFFRDLFASAVERPNVTATEVLERKAEMVRVLGPTFGRLEEDYIGRIVTRVFNIMERAGAFPERPEALQGQGLEFSYHSPFQQARKSSEAVGISRSMEMLGPIAQLHPEVLDHFDLDEIARDTPEWWGFGQKYIKPLDLVEAQRQQRAQAEQAMAAQQMAETGGRVVRDVAAAERDVERAAAE